jgi:hypothetical protein
MSKLVKKLASFGMFFVDLFETWLWLSVEAICFTYVKCHNRF